MEDNNQNLQAPPEQPKPPTTGEDLLSEDLAENAEATQPAAQIDSDEAAMVAGVEAVGRVSILLAHIKAKALLIWTTPKYRNATIAGLVLLLLVLFVWPTTRYGMFNAVGLRGSADVLVIDVQSGRPVTGVTVKIHNETAKTDDDGRVALENVRLGRTTMVIDRLAYAESNINVTIGLGENNLGDVALVPIGTQFNFSITDWLSESPIEKARISYDGVEALTDSDGIAILTIPPTDEEEIAITISGQDYHDLETSIKTTGEATNTVTLVSSPLNYFMSQRDGNYDLYSSRLDGSEQQLILAGSGQESRDLRLSVSPNARFGALVSTRSGVRDANGRLQHNLNIVNLELGTLKEITTSQDIQLVGWIDSNLVYVEIGEGQSTFSPTRHQIISYDTESGDSRLLEASNHFNDVRIIAGEIYYAADDSFKQETPLPYLYRMDEDGLNKTALIEKQSWTIFRTGYDNLLVNTTKNGWFDFSLDSQQPTELEGQPSTIEDRVYVDGPENDKTVWIDQRDGKGVLIVRNTLSQQEEIVHQAAGLQAPLRWVDEHKVIYRIQNSQETADYVIDLRGGEPKKIVDVSAVDSATRWFYY